MHLQCSSLKAQTTFRIKKSLGWNEFQQHVSGFILCLLEMLTAEVPLHHIRNSKIIMCGKFRRNYCTFTVVTEKNLKVAKLSAETHGLLKHKRRVLTMIMWWPIIRVKKEIIMSGILRQQSTHTFTRMQTNSYLLIISNFLVCIKLTVNMSEV